MRRIFNAAILAMSCAVLIGPGSGFAGNLDNVFLGNDAALTGGAVVSRPRNGGAAWYNPAGLVGGARNSIDLSASAFTLRIRDVPEFFASVLPDGAASVDLQSVELISIPAALVYSRRLADNLWGAVGIFVPTQDLLTLRSIRTVEWEVVGSDGTVQPFGFRQGLSVFSSQQQYFIGPAIGWEPVPGFRIGVSLFVVYATSSARSRLWAELATAVGDEVSRSFSYSDVEVDATAIGGQAVLGLVWEPGAGLSIGAVLRSPVVRFAEWVDSASLAITARTGSAFGPSFNEVVPTSNDTSATGFDVIQPLRVHLGVSWAWDAGWVSLEADVRPPMDAGTIGGRSELVWNLRAGTLVDLDESIALGAGFFTDHSPAPEPTQFGESHVDYYGVTFGVQHRSLYQLATLPEADGLVFGATFAVRYALGTGQFGLYRANLGTGLFEVRRTQVWFHELSLHLGSGVWF